MPLNSGKVPISSKNNRAARAAHARAKEEFKTYDTSAIRPKQPKVPIIIAVVVALVVIAVIALIAFQSCNYEIETLPPSEEATVVIEQGESAKEVTASLFKERLIGSEKKFMSLLNAQNAAGSLIPGTYVIQGGTSMDSILSLLLEGPEAQGDTLTVPEGITLKETAAIVETATKGRITADDFIAASSNASVYAADYTFLTDAGDKSLEGFLFPKTYSVSPADDASAVVKKMLDQFRAEVLPINMDYPKSHKLSLYDTIKLASIVQKEGNPQDYKTIASVFYNRLGSNRPYLQSDVTTAYEVGHIPSAEEVHANTPYSTYSNPGLPPTPICNPSLDAILAVCNPDQTDYMYFYSYEDGTTKFSKTYDEHMASIR